MSGERMSEDESLEQFSDEGMSKEELNEFKTRHGFSYRIGVNDKYHLKDSLEIDNSLANLLEKKIRRFI